MTVFSTGTIINNALAPAHARVVGETLTIQQGAVLIGSGTNGTNRAVWLQTADEVYTVNVGGSIIGTGPAAVGQVYLGLVLDNSNVNNQTHSAINVDTTGSIFGSDWGVYTVAITDISNFGSITSNSIGVFASAAGNYSITNFGTIAGILGTGLLLTGLGTHTIENSGRIAGSSNAISTGGNTNLSVELITNTGVIEGKMDLGGGDDVVHSDIGVLGGNVTLGAGNDQFYGSRNVDTVFGGDGGDLLDGKGGVDNMTGGQGNDTYVVDDANDIVNEVAGLVEGFADMVNASVSYGLRAGVALELLQTTSLTGTANIDLGGNELQQEVIGNAGNNIIDGGADNLVDSLKGYFGNDTYVLHGAVADTIIESGGNDTIATFIDRSLVNFTGVENLLLVGSNAINGTGDGGANKITGNTAVNILDGGAGADTLIGGTGSDTYIVDRQGDNITELTGEGLTDTVQTSASYFVSASAEIEVIMTTNALAATAINLTGNNFKQTIIGNNGHNVLSALGGDDTLTAANGNDTLLGGLGNDRLTGGTGTDVFVFNTALNATTNKDTILDYNVAADTMRLENTGTGLFNALATGTLSAAAFVKGVGFTSGKDSSDRIVYNTTTGDLYYDKDGLGGAAAIKFATLTGHPSALNNADFLII